MEKKPSFLITQAAADQIAAVALKRRIKPLLRISVLPGGCNGFQYKFSPEETTNPEDLIFPEGSVSIIIDPDSFTLLEGASLDYEKGLIGSFFKIVNPQASSSCGCGNSFAPD